MITTDDMHIIYPLVPRPSSLVQFVTSKGVRARTRRVGFRYGYGLWFMVVGCWLLRWMVALVVVTDYG